MLFFLLVASLLSASQSEPTLKVRVTVQGETNQTTHFIESFRREMAAQGLTVELVPRSHEALDYNIVVAQETTIGSAAAAVVALDRDGAVAASVVRSGRLSGKGAVNACAKELAKRFATLTGRTPR